jgi:hypothetical protein
VSAWLNKCRLSGRWPWKLEKMDLARNHWAGKISKRNRFSRNRIESYAR